MNKKNITASGVISTRLEGTLGLLSQRGREGPSDAVMFGQRQEGKEYVPGKGFVPG